MPLTILNVAHPFTPVVPGASGGAEQLIAQLDRALVAAGHRSLVIACEGSQVNGTLLPTRAITGLPDDEAHAAARVFHRKAILAALEREHVDLVHLHGVDFADYLPPPGVPVLVTLHLPPSWYPPHAFCHTRPDTYLHCVCPTQTASCPPGTNLLASIPNGVPIDGTDGVAEPRENFVLSLGRICAEKAHHLALDAAGLADIPMILAGRLYEHRAHRDYFSRCIQPRLDEARRFIGPVASDGKRALLSRARALVVPSLAPETNPLIAMEALACGTPVIVSSAGALAKVVEHGRTGFVADGVKAIAKAIAALDQIDPDDCRAAARERFSVERTNALYLRRYHRLASGRALRAFHEEDATASLVA